MRIQNALPRREREEHERELATRGQREAHAPGSRRRTARKPAGRGDRQNLQCKIGDCRLDDLQGLGGNEPDVGGHADRNEEESEQKSLEGLDIRLKLVAEFAVGEHDACEERAERHREPHLIDEECGCDDGEKRGGGEDFGHLYARDDPQRRSQHQPAADGDNRNHRDELDEPNPPRRTCRRRLCDSADAG